MNINESIKKYLAPIFFRPMNFGKDYSLEYFVKKEIQTLVPELKEDGNGNLYLFNPNTPLICAHMDNVGSKEAQKHLEDMKIFTETNKDGVEQLILRGTHNIGADDKCGIILALALYKELGNKVSLLFTHSEEIGGIGIKEFLKTHSKELTDNCNYAIVPDRRNGGDFIGHNNGYCTPEFQAEVLTHISSYGFAGCSGSFSDCNSLRLHMNSFNISVGYYNAHSDKEYVNLTEFENTFNALKYLIENFNKKMDKPVEVVTHRFGGYSTTNKPFKYSSYKSTTTKPTVGQIALADYNFDEPITLVHHNGAEYKLPAGAYTIKTSTISTVKTMSPFGVKTEYKKTIQTYSPFLKVGDACPSCGENDYAGRNYLQSTSLTLENELYVREVLYCPCCGFMTNKWGANAIHYEPKYDGSSDINSDDGGDISTPIYDFCIMGGERFMILPNKKEFSQWFPHCPYCYSESIKKVSEQYYSCRNCDAIGLEKFGYTLVPEILITDTIDYSRGKSISASDLFIGLYKINNQYN